MHATTLKIENPLLGKLNAMRPRGLSLSAFVRDILEDAVKRKRMAESAGKYTALLKDHPDEEAWLDDWDAADLARPPSRKKGSL